MLEYTKKDERKNNIALFFLGFLPMLVIAFVLEFATAKDSPYFTYDEIVISDETEFDNKFNGKVGFYKNAENCNFEFKKTSNNESVKIDMADVIYALNCSGGSLPHNQKCVKTLDGNFYSINGKRHRFLTNEQIFVHLQSCTSSKYNKGY